MNIPDRFTTIDPQALTGTRLRLREWTEADRAPFAALNADPRVMAHFPFTLTRAQSDAYLDEIRARMARRGWGLWAAELIATDASAAPFVGLVGLNIPGFALPFGPCVEIGWRLAHRWWGQGLASEAARIALRVGFEQIGLDEIVSFTTLGNWRSRAVMDRLGMQESPAEAFDHPLLPADSPLRPHCLYRLPRTRWAAAEISPH